MNSSIGAPSSVLSWQDLIEEQRKELYSRGFDKKEDYWDESIKKCGSKINLPKFNSRNDTLERLQYCFNNTQYQENFQHSSITSISTCTIAHAKLSNSVCNTMTSRRHSFISSTLNESHSVTGLFGKLETVCMTLFNDFCRYRASGTQATAFINKCLQVKSEIGSQYESSTLDTNSNCGSSCTSSTFPSRQSRKRGTEITRYNEVYFFGRKKEAPKSMGMGCKGSNTKIHRTGQISNTAIKSDKGASNTQAAASLSSSTSVQTKNAKGATAATSTMKAVSIREDKPKKPCPALGATKGDMMATVSHIRIGPREPCPVHGKEPCQGPKCIVASSGEEQAPVKVTTVTNPRRGVFEIVIRKMTGAPLAKNELMLEWTPPPSRPAPCSGPCPIPCAIPTPCRPSKCKMIICRPSPCRPKCCKKPCVPKPCRSIPCKNCCKLTSCGKRCNPCGPPPPCKTPCSISCAPPCYRSPCSSPCKSSPCLRPCPVGRKRPRKARSQPKIKMNRKRTSPCLNRSKACPVVRCRSMPAPCIGCCLIPSCPPRKCCSVAPCKPPKCCKSSCSVCCGTCG